MRTFKIHKALVEDAMNAANQVQKQQEIIDASNVCMNTLAGLFPIGGLMRKITVTAGDDAWLPDNLAGITMVRDNEDNSRLIERGEAAAFSDEEFEKYYEEIVYKAASSSAFPFKSTGSIAAGSSDLTCADLYNLSQTEAIAGLTVRIVNATYGEYYYEIDSINVDNTIALKGSHPYDETNVEVTIRREMSRRIRFVDSSEELIESGDYDVYYWVYPNPFSQDTDIIPLIYPDVLELMTIRRLPETKDRRPVSKTEIDNAITMAKKREPNQSPPARPLTQQGGIFKMGKTGDSPYNSRGG